MPVNAQQARQLVENPVFEAVFDDYEASLYKLWRTAATAEAREKIHARSTVVREVKQQLKNTAADYGHGTNS